MTDSRMNNERSSWMSRGNLAALVSIVVGITCLIMKPHLPWLTVWPDSLTLPAMSWITTVMNGFVDIIKPLARLFSQLIAYPMYAANSLLVAAPWPIVIGAITALAWYLGGTAMTALALCGLGFILASGYWTASMNTLALVAVSVPLALISGLAIGLLAYQVPRFKPAIQSLLDIMQTVPTFAYLTPLLLIFGFGPVVGLVASAIYAAPPMARNVLLGLERVEPEIKEAAIMSGGKRWQQLLLVEVPSASQQIMIGINQTLMAALSMVIIAAVIGGFNDIGWEVLMTMRKAEFGRSFIAGLVVVIFAILIDRMSMTLTTERTTYNWRVSVGIIITAVVATWAFGSKLPTSESIRMFDGFAAWLDSALGTFTGEYGNTLNAIKNNAMFYVLLPLRIGLKQAVNPFTWGIEWTITHEIVIYLTAFVLAAILFWKRYTMVGFMILLFSGILITGIAQLPWPFVLISLGALGWVAGGRNLALFCMIAMATILLIGLWNKAMLSLYLAGVSVLACVIVGGLLGTLSAVSPFFWRFMRPICDMLQTIPLFVFLIPVLMFFQIGEFSAFLAICLYAIVPMIRYTRHGLVSTPEELIEAAIASGATPYQVLREVRYPYAVPTILLGLNQTILYAFSMLVIAALIGTTELGQAIFLALGQADIGLGIAAGGSMALLALIADRLVQGFASKQREALGL